MLFTHSMGSSVFAYPIIQEAKKILDKEEIDILWAVAAVSGVLPDFDLLYVILHPGTHHRYLISHSIVPYLFAFLFMFIISSLLERRRFGKRFFFYASLVFIAGIISHLFFDFFLGGVSLLKPYTDRYFGFLIPKMSSYRLWIITYLKSYYMFIEGGVFLTFLALFIKEKNRVMGIVSGFFVLFAFISALFFSIYLN